VSTPAPVASIAVIGGSISGCAAAIAARRAGHRATVYERSGAELAERGFGICIPDTLHAEAVADGYIGQDMPFDPVSQRIWLARIDDGGQRELWRQPSRLFACNWGLLWNSMRSQIPDDCYLQGRKVVAVRDTDAGPIVCDESGEQRFDLVVGADGYRSIIRNAINGDTAPEPAGYVTWRGAVNVTELADCAEALDLLDDAVTTVGFPGGHAIFYLIPDADGGHRLNWLVYTTPPGPQVGLSMSYASDTGLSDLTTWFEKLVDRRLPAVWARVVHRTPAESRAFQPIFDLALHESARLPYLLIGDASTITRPHTASGATKALQDARCLEQVLGSAPSWRQALSEYDSRRTSVGNALVETGRRMGRDQVTDTPDWTSMTPQRMSQWLHDTMAGQKLYFLPGES
jgi:2-polyprenyl-6-methoxyphenol hydroxylase-like FAD-dependent oxidoreductase